MKSFLSIFLLLFSINIYAGKFDNYLKSAEIKIPKDGGCYANRGGYEPRAKNPMEAAQKTCTAIKDERTCLNTKKPMKWDKTANIYYCSWAPKTDSRFELPKFPKKPGCYATGAGLFEIRGNNRDQHLKDTCESITDKTQCLKAYVSAHWNLDRQINICAWNDQESVLEDEIACDQVGSMSKTKIIIGKAPYNPLYSDKDSAKQSPHKCEGEEIIICQGIIKCGEKSEPVSCRAYKDGSCPSITECSTDSSVDKVKEKETSIPVIRTNYSNEAGAILNE